MSSMLEQAIVDAKALKEAAIKNAESTIIEKYAQEMHNEFGFSSNLNQKISAMWININKRGVRNALHFHANSFLSGVFYLQIKAKLEEGSLSFRNPNSMMMMSQWISPGLIENFNPENVRGWQVCLSAGDLILFPSWLEHEVFPHNENEDRISISFNTTLVEN